MVADEEEVVAETDYQAVGVGVENQIGVTQDQRMPDERLRTPELAEGRRVFIF